MKLEGGRVIPTQRRCASQWSRRLKRPVKLEPRFGNESFHNNKGIINKLGISKTENRDEKSTSDAESYGTRNTSLVVVERSRGWVVSGDIAGGGDEGRAGRTEGGYRR